MRVCVRGNRCVLAPGAGGGNPRGGDALRLRGRIRTLTKSSSKRLVDYLHSSIAEYVVLVTLTWPANMAPEPASAWAALRALRKRAERRSAPGSWCWIREFTSAGVIHYHVWAEIFVPKNWLSDNWCEICGGGIDQRRAGTRAEAWRGKNGLTSREGAAHYAAKYAAKCQKLKQKQLPAQWAESGAGRWWGIFGSRSVLAAAYEPRACRGYTLPPGPILGQIRDLQEKGKIARKECLELAKYNVLLWQWMPGSWDQRRELCELIWHSLPARSKSPDCAADSSTNATRRANSRLATPHE